MTDNGTPNLNDFETIEVTVGEVNVAPELAAIGNKSTNEDNLLTFMASATDADAPANTLTFSLDAGAPSGASIDASSGVFTWTPSEAQGAGTYNITVWVTDNGTPNLDDFETIEVTVGEVNVAPELASLGNKSVNEGSLLTFTASATDADVPANTLTFSLDAGAPSGASIDASSGVFTWTPSEAQGPGTYNITVRVTDDGTPNLNDFETIEVMVGDLRPWQYFVEPRDVNRDGFISPLDALIVINDINSKGPRVLVGLPQAGSFYIDVNGDGSVSPVDALVVINRVNDPSLSAEGEGAGVALPPLNLLLPEPVKSAASVSNIPPGNPFSRQEVSPLSQTVSLATARESKFLRTKDQSHNADLLDLEEVLDVIGEEVASALFEHVK